MTSPGQGLPRVLAALVFTTLLAGALSCACGSSSRDPVARSAEPPGESDAGGADGPTAPPSPSDESTVTSDPAAASSPTPDAAPACPEISGAADLGVADDLVWQGDFTLSSDEHAALLEPYWSVSGDLLIGSSTPLAEGEAAVTELALPNLRSVSGTLHVANTELTTLRLPQLTNVARDLTIRLNLKLQAIELPELRSATSLYIDSNLVLQQSGLPLLEHLFGQLFVHRNTELDLLGLGRLKSARPIGELRYYVTITANGGISECEVELLLARTGIEADRANLTDLRPGCLCSEACGQVYASCP